MNKDEALKKLSEKNKGRILEFEDEINALIKEIKVIEREPRASAILIEGYIGYACDKLLAYRFEVDVFEDLNLHDKRAILEKLGIINKDLSKDIKKIQGVRNIYAHRRKITDTKTLQCIEEIIKNTHIYTTLNEMWKNKEPFELFMLVGSRILALLNEKYRMMMIAEINKFAEEFKDEKY